jgi:hypothetical protein
MEKKVVWGFKIKIDEQEEIEDKVRMQVDRKGSTC